MERTKRCGEDIVCRDASLRTRAEAKKRAVALSTSKTHGWANVYFLIRDQLMKETYADGKLYAHQRNYFDAWYSSTKTVRQAIIELKAASPPHQDE